MTNIIMLVGLTMDAAMKTEIFLQKTKGVVFKTCSSEEGLFDIFIHQYLDSQLVVNIYGGDGKIVLSHLNTDPESWTRKYPVLALCEAEYYKMEII